MEGYMSKWINYVLGWKRRYFILHNGILFYCKDKGQRTFGTIHLYSAIIIPHAKEVRRFHIDTGTTVIQLRGYSLDEAKRWQVALAEAKSISKPDAYLSFQSENKSQIPDQIGVLWNLQAKIEELVDLEPRNSSQLLELVDLTYQIKTKVAELYCTIDQKQEQLRKVHTLTEDKQHQVKEEYEQWVEQSRFSSPATLGLYHYTESNDEFYDAQEDSVSIVSEQEEESKVNQSPTVASQAQWRTILPAMKDPNQPLEVWKLLKDSIGSGSLYRITVPVYFNEPLSFLQRLAEEFEYSHLLDSAAQEPDPSKRTAYVAAFAISCYSSVLGRAAKPFNPILGETYEMASNGMKYIAEQVCHHPPISAQHCETDAWICWSNVEIKTSFKGTYLRAQPTGTFHFLIKSTGDHITWTKPAVDVHNLIMGQIYIYVSGQFEARNIDTGDVTKVDMKKQGWFDKGTRETTMEVFDAGGNLKHSVAGHWDRELMITNQQTNESSLLWRSTIPPQGYENYHFFTAFTLHLNMGVETLAIPAAASDSRHRPDQKALENGDLDFAGAEKLRLEEKQRGARKILAEEGRTYAPRWYRQIGEHEWEYVGGYWEEKESQNWTNVPDLF